MAKKETFTLGGGGIQKNTTNRIAEVNAKAKYNFQYIPHDKFYANDLNKSFSQNEIEELALSIEAFGLFHNLVAVYDSEKDMYRLISGERRWRAIGTFSLEKQKELFPKGIPTKVETLSMDEVEEEIRIREANTDRGYKDSDYRNNISRLVELYKIKQLRGENDNLAKILAEKTKMSERQIQKYINTEKLIPELDELFKTNKISLNYANKFSGLPADAQKYIYSLYVNGSTDNIIEDYEFIKQNVESQREENKRLHQEINSAKEELDKKESIIASLTEQINNVKNIPYEEKDQDDIIKELKSAKDRAEQAQKTLHTKLENMELQQKELQKRNITISKDELRRIQNIAKAEQALSSMEENIKILKNNKSNILADETLKQRVNIMIIRLQNLSEED